MDQWIEDVPVWRERFVAGTQVEATDMLFEWVEGRVFLLPEVLADAIRRVRNVELDCERRTVAKIRAFNLPINVVQYIRNANSYLFFLTAMQETRSWYHPGREPYNVAEVLGLVPTVFLENDAYEAVPEALMDAYRAILAL